MRRTVVAKNIAAPRSCGLAMQPMAAGQVGAPLAEPMLARHRPVPLACMAAAALWALCGSASAFEFDTGVDDLKLRWDNTVKYSAGFRMEKAANKIIGGDNYDTSSSNYFPNTDDGDRNFSRGLVSNRFDLLSEMDVQYEKVGFRITGSAWYDTVYQDNDTPNKSASTFNPVSTTVGHFAEPTRQLQGGDAELLDAFAFARFDLASVPVTVRLGKHTVLYGESLMMGANGIAAAQAPIDVIKAATVPSAQFKEFMRPVNQISAQAQLTPDVMVGGYYILNWRSDRLPGSGSYFGFMDALGIGGERLIVSHSDAVGNIYFKREKDYQPDKAGQFGLQLKMRFGDVDYGLYAVRWNDHGPSGLYLHPYDTAVVNSNGLEAGTYQWVFHQGIKAVGASFSTSLDSVNVAGEVSYRWNTPLDSDAQTDTVDANNTNRPLYAIGRSAHAQVSWLASLGNTFISREADLGGELAWNRRLAITANENALNPNATRDAVNVRVNWEPKYYQVLPGLNLSVPIGVGYGLKGNSSVVGGFMGRKTGDLGVGVNGAYLDVWQFGVNFTHYLGAAAPFIEYGHRTFKQYYADRDYLTFNMRRTF